MINDMILLLNTIDCIDYLFYLNFNEKQTST